MKFLIRAFARGRQAMRGNVIGMVTVAMVFSLAFAADDWDEVVTNANKEGKVVVYSTTSRITLAAQLFEEKYGIPVEAHHLSATEIVERTYQEARSGVKSVDVLLIEDYPSVLELLVKPGYLETYVPPSAEAIPAEYQEPLVFAYLSRIIGYNTEVYPNDPFDSIWDLTTPEYRGKVMIRDLANTGEHQNAFTELVRRSDELAADYERRFGEPLELTEPNAGLEFMRRLVQNDIILMSSDTRISEAVGARGQADPPFGMFYVLSHHRYAETKNLAIEATHNMKPLAGYYYGIYVMMAANTEHPNAGKLFADFLFTPEGFSPWSEDNTVGFYSMHPGLESSPDDYPWEWWKERIWTYDPEYAAQNRGVVLDAWLRYVQQ